MSLREVAEFCASALLAVFTVAVIVMLLVIVYAVVVGATKSGKGK